MKDKYYFPHDYNAIDDPKIMMMVSDLGLEGYGIYWVLIEHLRQQPDFKSNIKVLKPLALRNGSTQTKFEGVVKYYDLFQMDGNEFFYSASLIERMQPLLKKKEQGRLAGIASGIARRERSLNGSSTGVERTLNNKRRGEEIREDKIREECIVEKKSKIPTLQQVKDYFKEKGYSQESAVKAFNYYEAAREPNDKHWKDGKGNLIKSWKQKMIGVWFKPENKALKSTTTQTLHDIYGN